ncbi:hypothetical protein AtEden1_Chr1g0018111 [Arabidopsis thaliana]
MHKHSCIYASLIPLLPCSTCLLSLFPSVRLLLTSFFLVHCLILYFRNVFVCFLDSSAYFFLCFFVLFILSFSLLIFYLIL